MGIFLHDRAEFNAQQGDFVINTLGGSGAGQQPVFLQVRT
jgi:hypothetical protein